MTRPALLLFALLVLALGACAPRVYDATEIDQPPILVGDSLEVTAPRPAPPDTLR
jgi:hypothetical protein